MRRFLLLGIAALVLIVGMTSSAVAQTNTFADGDATLVVPGQEFTTHEINVTDPSDTKTTNVTHFNITAFNGTIENDDIVNISIVNKTEKTVLGYEDDPVQIAKGWANISISEQTFDNVSYYYLVNITLNTTGDIDGRDLAPKVYVTTNKSENTGWANDTVPETIEVLNTTVGPSNTTAWEGQENVLCGNVTIVPGNNTVDNHLKEITFNTTAETTLDPAYIESFGLWNDTDADKTFNPSADTLINSSSPTEGANVTFDLANLPMSDRTIPAGQSGTYFLTMNITSVAHTGKYQAQVFAQNITINQTAGEGNTGNSTDTTGFSILLVDPSDVWIYNSPVSPVSPGKSYVAYNVTYTNTSASANVTWYNVTGMNDSISNLGDINDITNVSVYNATSGSFIRGNSTLRESSPYFTVNLNKNKTADLNTTSYKFRINLTINNSAPIDSWDGTNVAVNATLRAQNFSSNSGYDEHLTANDPSEETIVYKNVADPTTAFIQWNESTFYPNSTARISVYDPDYSDTAISGSTTKQTVVVRAWTDTAGNATSNYEEVELVETGQDTGWFNGTVTFNTLADSHSNDELAVRDGDTVYVQLKDKQNQNGATALTNDTSSFEYTRDGSVSLNQTKYNTSETAKITVEDKDENTDSGTKESITVNVNSSTDPSGIDVTLTETTISSGVFTGTFDFTTTGSSSGNTLKVTRNSTHTVNETVNVTYWDKKDAAGNSVNRTATSTFYGLWTGSVWLNQSTYLNKSAIRVNLNEPDLNENTSAYNTPQASGNYTLVLVNTTNTTALANLAGHWGDFDTENITKINETGPDTGVFFNDTIKMDVTSTADASDSGNLSVEAGQGFSVVYLDYNDSYGTKCSYDRAVNVWDTYDTASTYQIASTSVWWNTSGNLTGNVLNVTSADVYGKDTVARISINDADANADSSVNETEYVLVNSSGNTINISVKETGPDTGIFNGTLHFGKSSDEANRVIGVNSSSSKLVNTRVGVKYNDTANATGKPEWQNVTFTHWWTANGTITWNDTTNYLTYYNTSVMKITVDDADRNVNTSAKESFNVTVTSWNATGTIDNVNVNLSETTNKSGVFEGFLNFSETASNYAVNESTLKVADDCKFNISYWDTNTSVGNTSMWINETNVSQYDKTRTGTVGLSNLNPYVGETVNVSVTDYDQNTNASTYQQVKVDVWSDTTGENGSITLTLNETSASSAKFVGNFNFSTSATNATLNQIKVSDSDNITAEYVDPLDINGSQKTVTNSSAWVTVHYTSEISLNESSYKPNQTAMVTLDDEDLNMDPTIAETVSGVNISSDKYNKGFNITLKETGDDTGIFERTISFTTSGSASPSDRIINVSIGGTVYANYTDTANVTGDSETVSASAAIEKTIADSLTLDRDYYNASQTVHVTIKDSELNDDSTLAEVYYASQTPYSNVSVNSTTDQTGFNLSIEETGKDTGVFEGSFTLKPGGPTDAAKKELNVSTGDTINVSYLNTKNVTGDQETMLQTATFDNEPPSITNLISDVSLAGVNTVVNITVDVNDSVSGLAGTPVATVNGESANFVSVDNGTYTYNYTVTANDTEGNATVNVTATDNVANTATKTKPALFTIDTTAPSVSVSLDKSEVNLNETVNITVDASDTVTTAENLSVEVMVDSTSVNLTRNGSTWTGNFSTDVAGEYTVTAEATDEAGNSATNTSSFTVKAPANVSLVNFTMPTEGVTPFKPTVTVTLRNTGGVAGDYNVTLWVDGSIMCYNVTTVPANATETMEFVTPHAIPAGTYNVTVGDETMPILPEKTLTVKAPANVSVESFDVEPSTVNVSEPFKLNATVENTGGVAGDIGLSFKKENATTGAMEVFDSKTVSVDASETVYVESNSTSYAKAGDYDVTVNDLANKTVTVQRVCTANEHLVKKYYTEYNCAANLTQDDVVQAVTAAVHDYFAAKKPAKKQEIVDDVTTMVKLYFSLA